METQTPSGAEGEGKCWRGRRRRTSSKFTVKLVLSEEPGCLRRGDQVACDSALVHSTGGHGRGEASPGVLLVGAQGGLGRKGS